ncbi:MAG: hypothetical protein NTW74_12735 [Acidobacteria bacterium]|nr:hypothetical protein [Acidobacteriota bacterium]
MKPLAILVALTFLPIAHSSQIQPGAPSLEFSQIWNVLTNSFAQDPIYQWRDARVFELDNERGASQINMVGKTQLVSLRVVLPAGFEYDPN